MAGLKYSRQREAILSFLHSTKEHPTAEAVYEYVKKEYPRISLGTVYRNLNLLVECGEVRKLNCGDGFEHFDGDTSPHYHFLCNECGHILDLEVKGLERMNTVAAENFDGTIQGHKTYFYGTCSKCKKKN
ncbi:MAG: transcriptional repressor [Lachnospiraceae bacterium]|nr:transcriptional repressor [Lachnospiraceae bacterium]